MPDTSPSFLLVDQSGQLVRTVERGSEQRIKAEPGRTYRLLAQPLETGAGTDAGASVLATRHGRDLRLQYGDDTRLWIEAFYDDAGAAIWLDPGAGAGNEAVLLQAGAPQGPLLGDGGAVVYAHGEVATLEPLAAGEVAMQPVLATRAEDGLVHYLPGSDAVGVLGWGLGGAALVGLAASAGGGSGVGAADGGVQVDPSEDDTGGGNDDDSDDDAGDDGGSTPPLPALALRLVDDTGASATDRITRDGTVEIDGLTSGERWAYRVAGGAWQEGAGDRFVLAEGEYDAADIEVTRIVDGVAAGDVVTFAGPVVIDQTAPAAPVISLANDAGVSSSDRLTHDGTVNVSGLEAGASWDHGVDNWASWSHGSGSSFVLPEGVWAAGSIVVDQTDLAGNTSPSATFTQSTTIDTTAPVVTASSPVQGAVEVPDLLGTIQLVFSEPVARGSGNLVLSNGAGDTRSIPITDTTQVAFDGSTNTITLNLTAPLVLGTSYTVTAAPGVLTDLAGGAWAGLAGSALTFAVEPAKIELADVAAGQGGFVIDGAGVGDRSGYAVSNAGDVNGDGYDDLIIGAPYASPATGTEAGSSYVVFGGPGTSVVKLSAVAAGIGGFVINGETAGDEIGYRVSGAGDVNNDGYADLIVGSQNHSPGGRVEAGRSYVIWGKPDTAAVELSAVAAGSGGFVIDGHLAGDASGSSVSDAGDVNGDGLADLLIGADQADGDAGRSYVVFGRTDSSPVALSDVAGGIGGFVIRGQSADDNSGDAVASVGDVNGDGLADIIIGADSASPAAGEEAGRAYVVFGRSDTAPVDLSAVEAGTGGFVINGQCAGDRFAQSVHGVGDVNGDGLADFVLGANKASPDGRLEAGRAYVVFGRSDTTAVEISDVANGAGGFIINGLAPDDDLGDSVSAAGDINGDGLADLLISSSYSDPSGRDNAGRAYVVFGRSDGATVEMSAVANGHGGFAINGHCTSDRAGYSVSAAGDVNGDGLADLLIGATYGDPDGLSNAGQSYVVFGRADGTYYATAVDQIGTAGDDTLSDGGVAQTLVGGAGDDLLSAAAASVLYGGAGDDALFVQDAFITALQNPLGSAGNLEQLARADGGSGRDILALETASSQVLDLALVGEGRLSGIEAIAISMGGATNRLALSAVDVLGLSQANLLEATGRQQLVIHGFAGDVLELRGREGEGDWLMDSTPHSFDGLPYQVWNSQSAHMTLYVHPDVTVEADLYVPPAPLLLAEVAAGIGGFVLNGVGECNSAGTSVSLVGDVNGDGLDDLLVSAPSINESYVVFGRTDGVTVDLSQVQSGVGGFAVRGLANQNAGASVSAAGDVNGDGLADLLIGATGANAGGHARAGQTFVVYGKSDTATVVLTDVAAGTGGFVINGQSPEDLSGSSVALAGDVNGDGVADFIIGARWADAAAGAEAGRSYVVFGSPGMGTVELSDVASGVGGFMIVGAGAGDRSGTSVAAIGDVNGDGLADLLIGAPEADPAAAGSSYIVYGRSGTTPVELSAVAAGSGGFVIHGEQGGDTSGYRVASAGDVNGDGVADFIIGAPEADPAGRSGAGRSYVVFGQSNLGSVELSAVAAGIGGFVIDGAVAGGQSGTGVASAGDLNGDGLADLVIGAPYVEQGGQFAAGAAWVVYGKADTEAVDLATITSGRAGFRIDGPPDMLGMVGDSVAAAGDLNGDGLADLVIGASMATSSDGDGWAGRAYVVYGQTSGSFSGSMVDEMGTPGDDLLNDGGQARTLVGGLGDDQLVATGPSVLLGGAGNDTFQVGSAMVTALQHGLGSGGNVDRLATIHGGAGLDTLRLGGDAGTLLDLDAIVGADRLTSIEHIDLAAGNTLALTAASLFGLSRLDVYDATGEQQLLITGDIGSTVDLADGSGTTGWQQDGARIIDGRATTIWTSDDLGLRLYIEDGVSVA